MLAYWFDWDPNPFAFYINWLERPVAWYGILFVLGFIIGYQIIVRMFTHFMDEQGECTEAHVASWKLLVEGLRQAIASQKHPLFPLVALLPRETRKAIERNRIGPEEKASIITMIHGKNRQLVQNALPGALIPLPALSGVMVDRLTWYIVAGTLVGARFGHVVFYEAGQYWYRPWNILKTWEGGLASHGGAIGVIIALCFYAKYLKKYAPSLSFIRLLDLVAVPTALVACFIRLGNFVNQELLGTPTDLPWAVMFGHPADLGPLLPRHPVPLYDALANLLIFIFLISLWKKRRLYLPEGLLIGLFFVFCFTARFFIDFIKMPMETSIETGFLQMGQWLSIPFIIFGFWLISSALKKRKVCLRFLS